MDQHFSTPKHKIKFLIPNILQFYLRGTTIKPTLAAKSTAPDIELDKEYQYVKSKMRRDKLITAGSEEAVHDSPPFISVCGQP